MTRTLIVLCGLLTVTHRRWLITVKLIAPADDLGAAEVVLQPRQRILNSTGVMTHSAL
jgi:hypothetical protein